MESNIDLSHVLDIIEGAKEDDFHPEGIQNRDQTIKEMLQDEMWAHTAKRGAINSILKDKKFLAKFGCLDSDGTVKYFIKIRSVIKGVGTITYYPEDLAEGKHKAYWIMEYKNGKKDWGYTPNSLTLAQVLSDSSGITVIDPELREKDTVFNEIARKIKNEEYFEDFNIQNIRENSRDPKTNRLPRGITNDMITDAFSEKFQNYYGDPKSKALEMTTKMFETLLQDKLDAHPYLSVDFSEQLIHFVSGESASDTNTYDLYIKLGYTDEQIPDKVKTENKIESKLLINPKFIFLFLHNGEMRSKHDTPPIKITENLDWLDLGILDHSTDTMINYEIQKSMIQDYTTAIIQSLETLKQLTYSERKTLLNLKLFLTTLPKRFHQGESFSTRVDILISKISEVEKYLGSYVGDFIFFNIFDIDILKAKGMDKSLIDKFILNWRTFPEGSSVLKNQFLTEWLSISSEPHDLINNYKKKSNALKYIESILEIAADFHTRADFPTTHVGGNIERTNQILQKIISTFLNDISVEGFSSIIDRSSVFNTIDFHDISNLDRSKVSIHIFQMFILEYIKQCLSIALCQGDSSLFTEFNKKLYEEQKAGIIPPVFSSQYLNNVDFSGNHWLNDYIAKSASKISLHAKTKKMQSFTLNNMDEIGTQRSFTVRGFPAESHLYRVLGNFRDSRNILISKVQNMHSDDWFLTSLNFQHKLNLDLPRTGPDVLINHANKRIDYRKDVYGDSISFMGLLIGKDGMTPVDIERAGVFGWGYFMKKMFDPLGVRGEFRAYSEIWVPENIISLAQREVFDPGKITTWIDKNGRRQSEELNKLLPPLHFNEDGSTDADYYNHEGIGIPATCTYKDLYRDVILNGNQYLFERLSPSQLSMLAANGIIPTEGNFAVYLDYAEAGAYYQAKAIAGKLYSEGKMQQFDGLKDFVLSLRDVGIRNQLGFSEEMARRLLITFGLRWGDGGYIWPQAEKMWDDLEIQNTIEYGGSNNQWAKISFYAMFNRIYQNSKQIQYLFDPNEFFSTENKLWEKLGYTSAEIQAEFDKFIQHKLVRYEGDVLYWNNFIGFDIVNDPPNSYHKLGSYQYFDIGFLNELVEGEFNIMTWDINTGTSGTFTQTDYFNHLIPERIVNWADILNGIKESSPFFSE